MDNYLSKFAHPYIVRIWSPRHNITTERSLWMAVLEAQIKQGLQIPDEDNVMGAYYAASQDVDLEGIRIREFTTRHDIKARIDVFNNRATCHYYGWKNLGGPTLEWIHLGLTSADVVDNVSLVKLRKSLLWFIDRHKLDHPASHALADYVTRMPIRGIKGAIGTMADQIELLGSVEAATAVDQAVASHFGFTNVLGSVGQVYPRSIDGEAVGFLFRACLDQPNINPNHSARALINGYLSMLVHSDQWNEGDVSTSVVRRVALPGACMAADVWLANRDLA